MDVTSWLDTKDFNCTFTDETIGGLPLAGLNTTWDDSARVNPQVPALNEAWGPYNSKPFRGVNLGGWLSLEPFITPSLFDGDPAIVDEWSLVTKLNKSAVATLEQHYATFITEDDFRAIAEAGLDHVRIPFSYWAVKTYDDDPYVMGVSWRYLLRGIEWARRYGLRVKLDLHAAPGSQNGWNHSGKQGIIDWIIGANGPRNADRTLDIHAQLSKFFAQDRYKNVIAFYGIINESSPVIPQDALISWTEQVIKLVQDNGVTATQCFSESFRGLSSWYGKLSGHGDKLAIDVHEYTIFDTYNIGLKHADRIAYACKTWTDQISGGLTGFGPTMVGEWSQAGTDCAKYLNNVGNGARWNGTYGEGEGALCPTRDSQCNCDLANADPSTFTAEYKIFLKTWALAQMFAFEKSWGWFYWTWKTESAPLWSYQAGIKAGLLPPKAYERDWDCSKDIPSLGSLPEYY
jgi:glucan 1,3-beta-glucosidase